MNKDYIKEIVIDLFRGNLNKYTRKAFMVLPKLNNPNILDIGCGTGIPTLELARLSNGIITAMDIHQPSLDILKNKINAAGISHRIKVIKRSVFDMNFPEGSFDIVWAEGSIAIIGFKKGLRAWKRFIKPKGFLVVHDGDENRTKKLGQIKDCGYNLRGHFALSADTWWNKYYGLWEHKIKELTNGNIRDQEIIKVLKQKQIEVNTYKMNPERCSSVFFIMQKS